MDYRALYKFTIKNKYSILLVVELFDQLSKAEYFTKLDLRFKYWKVRMAKGDETKATCVMRYGIFMFLVMPFGLTNASVMFCNLVNAFLDSFMRDYLDHIVTYNQTLEDHLVHLGKAFDRLRQNQLYVKK